jgi:undecaprenyl-diphosphatase
MNNSIFQFFYSLSSIPFFAKVSLFLSYSFTYSFIFLIGIWAIFISKKKMFNFSLFFFSGFFSWLISETLKNILKINRPFIAEHIVPLHADVGFSFPSSHMALFTAVAVSMFFVNKRAGFIFTIIAILIGISRMIIGVHYPSDILGGFFVGLITSLIFTEIFKKI